MNYTKTALCLFFIICFSYGQMISSDSADGSSISRINDKYKCADKLNTISPYLIIGGLSGLAISAVAYSHSYSKNSNSDGTAVSLAFLSASFLCYSVGILAEGISSNIMNDTWFEKTGKTVQSRKNPWAWYWTGHAIAGIGAAWLVYGTESQSGSAWSTDILSGLGAMLTIGTGIMINGMSYVYFSENFDEKKRELHLSVNKTESAGTLHTPLSGIALQLRY